jgi:hypothetical protein
VCWVELGDARCESRGESVCALCVLQRGEGQTEPSSHQESWFLPESRPLKRFLGRLWEFEI